MTTPVELNGTSVLDTEELTELYDIIGADGLGELVEIFAEEQPHQLEAIRTGVATQDAPGIRSATHLYKGSAAGVCAQRVTKLASILEHEARESRLDNAEELFNSLYTESVTALNALQDFLSQAVRNAA